MAPATSTARGSRRRIQLLVLCAVAGFALLAMRATWLGAIRSSSLSKQADLQHLITVDLPAARGSILSADGQALAVDRPTMLVTADARYVTNPAQLARDHHVRHPGRRPASREARGRPAQPQAVRHPRQAGADQGGRVPAQARPRRRALHANLGPQDTRSTRSPGQVLGLTDVDSGKGIDGLERLENERARGTPRDAHRDPRPAPRRDGADPEHDEPAAGQDRDPDDQRGDPGAHGGTFLPALATPTRRSRRRA